MAKRRNNEGSVIRQPDGTYRGSIWIVDPSEKRVRKYARSKTREGIEQKLQQISTDNELAKQGVEIDVNQTYGDFLERWSIRDRATVKPITIQQRQMYIRKYLSPNLGHIPLRKLHSQHIENLYDSLLAVGKSNSTMWRLKTMLSASLRSAHRQRKIATNPMDTVEEHPSLIKVEAKPLTNKERKIALSVNDNFRPFLVIMMGTGMRRGEAFGLTWDRVNLDEGFITIDRQVHLIPDIATGKQVLGFAPTKTNTSRDVWLASDTVQAFKVWNRQQQLKGIESEFVFARTSDDIHYGETFQTILTNLCKKLQIRRLKFKDFRTTYGTLSAKNGVEIKSLHIQMGHSSMDTTLEYYNIPDDETMKNESSKLDGVFALEA